MSSSDGGGAGIIGAALAAVLGAVMFGVAAFVVLAFLTLALVGYLIVASVILGSLALATQNLTRRIGINIDKELVTMCEAGLGGFFALWASFVTISFVFGRAQYSAIEWCILAAIWLVAIFFGTLALRHKDQH